ncbi:hypothetical protein FQN55_004799 [Onygenales sp. PD_40]|nr:hypothetical protein FQN55_004799 [Onygenales sp. PD_40]KAK2806099.1 hypothetical protein FQN51_008052 [Onygenales sp. PD_10]
MGPSLFDNLSDGPAIVLSPQQVHSFPHFSQHDPSSFPMNRFRSESPKFSISRSGSCRPPSASTPLAMNPSRKRSREDYSLDESTLEHISATATPPVPAPAPEEQPIYGEGMVLLNPRSGMVISAESQTGTWYEEKAESTAAAAPPIAVPTGSSAQPDLPSRKSQRLDATASGWDDITFAAIQSKLQSSAQEDSYRPHKQGSSSVASSSSFTPQEPHVDDLTHLLGISWQRISRNDEDMAGAIRGWERYIENHFSRYIQEAEILVKHRGLNAYLVVGRPPTSSTPPSSNFQVNGNHNATIDSSPAFYLFSEDLAEARLVGHDWETTIRSLQSSPISYSEVLRAAERSPERVVEDKGFLIGAVRGESNGAAMGDGMGMDID